MTSQAHGCIIICEEPLSFQLREHLFWSRMKDLGLSIVTTQVQGYIIQSCLARYDEAGAEQLLRDWMNAKHQPEAYVTKWNPGSHYYALDQKFDNEFAAKEYLKQRGFKYLGTTERHAYTRQGD